MRKWFGVFVVGCVLFGVGFWSGFLHGRASERWQLVQEKTTEFHPQASELHTLWGGEQATSVRAERPNPPQLAHWIPVAHELTIYLSALPEYGRLCFVTETARYINGSGATLFHDCFRKEDLEQLGRETRTLRAALALDTAKK